MKKALLLVSVIALVMTSARAASRAPFEASATITSQFLPNGAPNPNFGRTISASGNNLLDFVSSLINTQGEFDLLRNSAYTANSTFLGVPNAITFNTNATGTQVTMALTPINFRETFTGATSGEVDDQIEEFFKKNGQKYLSDFLEAIARQSSLAVTDGNPTSATATAANTSFHTQGFTPVDELGSDLGGGGSGSSKPRFGSFGLGFNAGKFEAGDFEGESFEVSSGGLSIGLGERVRLLTPVSFSYLKVAGAQVGGFGANLALPIRFKIMDKESPWNWRVTPLGGVSARASVDLAGGALLWQAGAINSVDYRVNPKLIVCAVNQFTAHKSIKLEYGDFSFDPQVNQQIMKNGVRLVSPLLRRLIADVFVVDTRFLKDAAIDQFFSFGGSLSVRASERFNLTLGANYDTGDRFKSYSVGFSSAWKW